MEAEEVSSRLLVDGLDCRGSLRLGPFDAHETLEKTSPYCNSGNSAMCKVEIKMEVEY